MSWGKNCYERFKDRNLSNNSKNMELNSCWHNEISSKTLFAPVYFTGINLLGIHQKLDSKNSNTLPAFNYGVRMREGQRNNGNVLIRGDEIDIRNLNGEDKESVVSEISVRDDITNINGNDRGCTTYMADSNHGVIADDTDNYAVNFSGGEDHDDTINKDDIYRPDDDKRVYGVDDATIVGNGVPASTEKGHHWVGANTSRSGHLHMRERVVCLDMTTAKLAPTKRLDCVNDTDLPARPIEKQMAKPDNSAMSISRQLNSSQDVKCLGHSSQISTSSSAAKSRNEAKKMRYDCFCVIQELNPADETSGTSEKIIVSSMRPGVCKKKSLNSPTFSASNLASGRETSIDVVCKSAGSDRMNRKSENTINPKSKYSSNGMNSVSTSLGTTDFKSRHKSERSKSLDYDSTMDVSKPPESDFGNERANYNTENAEFFETKHAIDYAGFPTHPSEKVSAAAESSPTILWVGRELRNHVEPSHLDAGIRAPESVSLFGNQQTSVESFDSIQERETYSDTIELFTGNSVKEVHCSRNCEIEVIDNNYFFTFESLQEMLIFCNQHTDKLSPYSHERCAGVSDMDNTDETSDVKTMKSKNKRTLERTTYNLGSFAESDFIPKISCTSKTDRNIRPISENFTTHSVRKSKNFSMSNKERVLRKSSQRKRKRDTNVELPNDFSEKTDKIRVTRKSNACVSEQPDLILLKESEGKTKKMNAGASAKKHLVVLLKRVDCDVQKVDVSNPTSRSTERQANSTEFDAKATLRADVTHPAHDVNISKCILKRDVSKSKFNLKMTSRKAKSMLINKFLRNMNHSCTSNSITEQLKSKTLVFQNKIVTETDFESFSETHVTMKQLLKKNRNRKKRCKWPRN